MSSISLFTLFITSLYFRVFFLYLVGHIPWLHSEMTFTFISISDITNVIIELTTDFFKLMPKVPKSGGQILFNKNINMIIKIKFCYNNLPG